ncbi:MAG: ATP-binding cassette domain-containing protein [Fuerstiella sp.]
MPFHLQSEAFEMGLTPAIEVNSVSCVFGAQKVLWDLSLSIADGETVAFVGESGCGKSVTMKVMMQLLQPTSGTLRWFGKDVNQMSVVERRRERFRLGYLFQGAALFDSLTVFENVAFGLRQSGENDERAIRENVLDRLQEVGLNADIVTKRPSEISGGMQKRVGLARALALSPDVMFYDEPTTGLDPVNSRRIDDLILSVRDARGVTGIIVTHDFRTVQRVTDRIIMLYPRTKLSDDESQIIFDGSINELVNCERERVKEYIGDELKPGRAA